MGKLPVAHTLPIRHVKQGIAHALRSEEQIVAQDIFQSGHKNYGPPRASMSAASLALPVARLLAMKSSRLMKKTGASA